MIKLARPFQDNTFIFKTQPNSRPKIWKGLRLVLWCYCKVLHTTNLGVTENLSIQKVSNPSKPKIENFMIWYLLNFLKQREQWI